MKQRSQMSAKAGRQDIEQVIQLLVQGATPEELLQMGVPEQVIIEAIKIIEQSQAQQTQQPAQAPEGLAGMATSGMLNV